MDAWVLLMFVLLVRTKICMYDDQLHITGDIFFIFLYLLTNLRNCGSEIKYILVLFRNIIVFIVTS
jgi:hypothetical protein